MKLAIITVTPNGVQLGLKIKEQLPATIYAKAGRLGDVSPAKVAEYTVMKDLIKDLFHAYDALIFITSTGIAVRMLAPYIQHKVKDPAVLVIDDQGHFVISLLSGHLGGANDLTDKVAKIIKAQPVITTASDSQGKLAPDALAKQLDLTVYPLEHIKVINGELVAGGKIHYYLDEIWQDNQALIAKLREKKINFSVISGEEQKKQPGHKVFITPTRVKLENTLCITPKRLIAGIGCRKDVSYELLDQAIQAAKAMINLEDYPLSQITSTVVKAQEVNLLKWAREHQVAINFYDNEIMAATIEKFQLTESAFVKSQIGIGNVCQASILSYNPKAKIILNKTKFEKVTVSLAWE